MGCAEDEGRYSAHVPHMRLRVKRRSARADMDLGVVLSRGIMSRTNGAANMGLWCSVRDMVSRGQGGMRMTTGRQTILMAEPTNETADRRVGSGNGNNGAFTLTGRLQSFRHAFHGIGLMLRSQHNAWLHAFASVCILVMGGLFRLSEAEWCWIILAIMAVWTAEALNTALEFLADAASPEFHPLVKNAKDVAAGGVLISAVGSIVIGLLVLGHHLLDFLGKLF